MEHKFIFYLFGGFVYLLAFVYGQNPARCPPIKVMKDTIIRTRESVRNGAKLLYRTDVESSRECYELCCHRKSCSIGVIHYKKTTDESGFPVTLKTCFAFACGIPSRCSFMNHTGYAVIKMQRNEKPVIPLTKPQKSFPEAEKCPPGSPVAMCSDDPCDKAKCDGFPDASCMPSYCGGCFAKFYDASGQRLQCRAKKVTTQHKVSTYPVDSKEVNEEIDSNEKQKAKSPDHDHKSKEQENNVATIEQEDKNTKEETVEVMPEDTGGKPTESPFFPGAKTEEDPHAVKKWRTWLHSGDEIKANTSKPSISTTNAGKTIKGGAEEADSNGSKKPIEKVIVKKESPFSLALSVSLIICIVILIAVIIKLKCLGPKKKKKFAVDDGDYLINGMYL